MASQTYVSFKNGGATDETGLFNWFSAILASGVALGGTTPSALQVMQHAGGANMSIDVGVGAGAVKSSATDYYWVWLDPSGGVANTSVTASHPSLNRIDTVVMYVNESITQNVTYNNPGALQFMCVPGTPSSTPSAPSNSAIQTAIGASNPYYSLANIAVAAGISTITTSNITDLRTNIAFNGSLYGGSANTSGHFIPNAPDAQLALSNGWSPLYTNELTAPAVTSVTANGNRSYNVAFNGVDLTPFLSAGMRLKFTRSIAAPTQCTSLNGTTNFFNRSSTINGMTFTNNFVISAWIKIAAYPSSGTSTIASRYNGTSGWTLTIEPTGRLQLAGFNASSANFSLVTSYQSVSINKWVHVAAQLDMATFTATSTTSYTMIDGVDVPALVVRSGTNPTSLIQAGNLEIGSQNAGVQLFNGKIAQIAIYSAKVTEAIILGSISQTLVGTETNLTSAYSFNNSINDLNANANNLTANGSAVATNVDSPFALGLSTGLLEYGLITSISFSSNTTVVVQVPHGSALPTTGGINATSYSVQAVPFGFPSAFTPETLVLARAIFGTNSSSITSTATGGVQIDGRILTFTTPAFCSEVTIRMTSSSIGNGSNTNVFYFHNGSISGSTNEIAQFNLTSVNNGLEMEKKISVLPNTTYTFIGAASVSAGSTVVSATGPFDIAEYEVKVA